MKGKKLWKLAAGITIATLVVGAMWMLWPAREPVYQGNSLSYWLDDLSKAPRGNVDKQSEAAIAVQTMGTNAFPTLLHLLEARQNRLTETANKYLMRIPWFKIQFETADLKHDRAYGGFVVLGSLGRAAVPDLLRIYNRTPRDVLECARVGQILDDMGSAAELAVPSLVADLANAPDPSLRTFAACGLGRIGARPEIAIPALSASLDDADALVRVMSAQSLQIFAASARAALPMFKQVLVDLEEPDFSPLWKFYNLLESVATRPPASLELTILPDIDLPN